MFCTESSDEFLFPACLGAYDSRHWRMVRLALHAPWFVLTVEAADGDGCFKRTVCIARDTDLADVLESLGDAKAVGLLCMTPGWCSPTGQWSSREVREVWAARTDRGDCVVTFRDERGVEFGDPHRMQRHQASVDRRLILRIDLQQGPATVGDFAIQIRSKQDEP